MDLKTISQDPLEVRLTFAPDDACFHGHFPGNPVVPGALIAGLCLHLVRERLGRGGTLMVRRFSFARFAGPGAYDLRIEERDDSCLCTLRQGNDVFAQGRIEA
jgi:3-hydroxyacyl-[acyl-carrier-protein] dehydratase